MNDVYYFDIQHDKRWLRAIHKKSDILITLMNVIKIVGCGPFISNPQKNADTLVIDRKLKRVFIISPAQIQSFHFPFVLRENTGHTLLASLQGITIDAIIRDSIEYLLDTTQSFSDYRETLSAHFEQNEILEYSVDDIISLIDALFRLDDCYFRHDHDEKGAKEHGEGIHPIDHIDFFYSNCSSIKYGLSCQKEVAFLQQMANSETKALHISDQ